MSGFCFKEKPTRIVFLSVVFPAFLAFVAQLSATEFPLRVGPTQRYLVDQAGKPFLIQADAPWGMMTALTTNEVELYLATRRSQGFNAIIVSLIEHTFSGADNIHGAPRNRYGDGPFTIPGDFATPNDAFFRHTDWVIQRAADQGILVLLAACYLGYPGTSEGWYSEVMTNGEGKCRAYGRFIGERYRATPNIVWVMYGDRNPDNASPMVEAMVAGLKEYDTNHLITAHFQRTVSARDYPNNTAWLTLNTTYTTDVTYVDCLEDYRRTPIMPSILFEARYENEHGMTTMGLRRQAYTALLSGAAGHSFGNRPIWLFDNGWQAALSSPGATSMTYVVNLFLSRRWTLLIPDDSHRVIPSEYGSGSNYIASALASDGSSMIAYLPRGGTITVDLRHIAGGQAKPWWYDVRNGSAVASGLMPTSGLTSFTAPSNEDWVLVIDAADRNFGPPGVVVTSAALDVNAGSNQAVLWPLEPE